MIYFEKHSAELTYALQKLIQTVSIWLSCTEYVTSEGLFWWISYIVHGRGL